MARFRKRRKFGKKRNFSKRRNSRGRKRRTKTLGRPTVSRGGIRL